MRRRWRRRVQVGREKGASHAGEERRGLWQAASVQYHRDHGSRCADQMPRKYRYECSRQLLHLHYALVLGALSSWPVMSGEGLLPCLGRHFLRPENGGNHRGRSSRGTISCVTNSCQLRRRSPKVRCLSKLGAHTNLDWARRVCVYFGVCITTAVVKRRYVGSRQAGQACTEPRGTHASGSMSVGGASARGTEHPHVLFSCVNGSTPLN